MPDVHPQPGSAIQTSYRRGIVVQGHRRQSGHQPLRLRRPGDPAPSATARTGNVSRPTPSRSFANPTTTPPTRSASMSGSRPPPDHSHAGWQTITPGDTIPFNHNLGITATDLTVGLWFSRHVPGIHQYAYGGLTVNTPSHRDIRGLLAQPDQQLGPGDPLPRDTVVEQVRVDVVSWSTTATMTAW